MTYREFWQPLTARYDEGEAKAITRMVAEVRYGLTHADVLAGRMETVEEQQLQQLQQRLLADEPVQYVLGEAQFLGRWFHVEPGVLIPRPETEELVQHVLACTQPTSWQGTILDIGTGSGCIPIYLAKKLPDCLFSAIDISDDALGTARSNAERHGCIINFIKADILDYQTSAMFDIIVSNPPYVLESEKAFMQPNVLDYEPDTALFVPDDDPLKFYRAICKFAVEHLNDGGKLYFEINEKYGQETAELMRFCGFGEVKVMQDLFGKDRFAIGQKA